MSLSARAITSPELTLIRTQEQRGEYFAAILAPTTVYTAQVNQTFSTTDKIIEITYDNGSGTLGNVLADMTMLVGSTPGAHDKGICRVKSIDSMKVYIGETSHIAWVNNLYLTILRDWGLWARHVRIVDKVPYMDGTIAYSNQHTNFDPVPIMGGNRVLELTGASVSTQFNFADSYVPDSTISAYSTSSPGSSGSSGTTTATPTFTYNAVGWYPVYLTLTATNGKTFWGIRWVYVYNAANPLTPVEFPDNPTQEAETGGWQFSLRISENADPAVIRERALVIVFAKDYYGTTKQSIGQLAGCENIIATGWIGGEEDIHWNAEQGNVTFTAYTAHYWLGKIPSYPDGVRFTTGTPAAWTEIKLLTIDKGLHHFLHWRTTATRVMDVSLTGDTKYTAEVRSLASNLWEQLKEIGFLQIFARPGVDRFNRLFIQIHPQLVPTASRTWATVMTITKPDFYGRLDFRRVTVQPNAFVDLSGVSVNSNGKGTAYFSLSPGNTYPPYGEPDIQDRLLVGSQSESNTLAGLYRGWLNNEFPNIPITFLGNNRMIDCFPRQKCAITIAAEDTERGIAYAGNLIPRSVSLVVDPESGHLHTEVTFEAETFPDIAINGTPPGSNETTVTFPPLPPLPPLPPIEVIVPGTVEPTEEGGPPKVIAHDSTVGLLYTENFHVDAEDVLWTLVNAGLTQAQYQGINRIVLNLLTGEIYVARLVGEQISGGREFIAYAPSIGSTFTILEDEASIQAKFGLTLGQYAGINAIGIDPLSGKVAYVLSGEDGSGGKFSSFYVGSGLSFAGTVMSPVCGVAAIGSLSYGTGYWRLTAHYGGTAAWWLISTAGVVANSDDLPSFYAVCHKPVSTTDKLLHYPYLFTSNVLRQSTENLAVFSNLGDDLVSPVLEEQLACDPTGMLIFTSWDTGKRGRSSDGGATFVGIPNLPFAGEYSYDWAGGAGAESRWVAAKNGIVRFSNDWGTTWYNKEGHLQTVAPIPAINIIKVVEF